LTVANLALVTTALPQLKLSWNLVSALALGGPVILCVPGTVWRSLRRSVDLVRINFGALRTTTGRRRLAFTLAGGLAFLLVVGLLFGFGRGFAIGFAGGLVGVFAGGLMAGLTTRPVSVDLPRRVVSQGLAHTACMLAGGLAAGLAIGLGGGLAVGLAGGLAGGLVVGLAVGLTIGIFTASGSPWPRYAIACLLLARRGALPRRPGVLLDWAYDAGLVRLSGIAVQFRHREFQDWLITTHDRETAPSAGHRQLAGRTSQGDHPVHG
jgi:hypothetical protein